MSATFTDREAAERLLNRHAREVAAHMDANNLHSAGDLLRMPVSRWLSLIVKYDTTEPECWPQERENDDGRV